MDVHPYLQLKCVLIWFYLNTILLIMYVSSFRSFSMGLKLHFKMSCRVDILIIVYFHTFFLTYLIVFKLPSESTKQKTLLQSLGNMKTIFKWIKLLLALSLSLHSILNKSEFNLLELLDLTSVKSLLKNTGESRLWCVSHCIENYQQREPQECPT